MLFNHPAPLFCFHRNPKSCQVLPAFYYRDILPRRPVSKWCKNIYKELQHDNHLILLIWAALSMHFIWLEQAWTGGKSRGNQTQMGLNFDTNVAAKFGNTQILAIFLRLLCIANHHGTSAPIKWFNQCKKRCNCQIRSGKGPAKVTQSPAGV